MQPTHAPHTEGFDHVLKMAEIRGIQQALRPEKFPIYGKMEKS